MKAATSAIILAAAIFASSQGTITRAAEVDIGFFYENLGSHGEWVEVPDYGHCWVPRSISHDWRPYTLGHWGYTDDCGWTWISDEPFGWIVYHYGRWVRLQDTGWCWVPDTVWGPAWASFRHSDEYVGWAPLPPEAYYRTAGFGAWVDAYYDIGPDYYTFVPLRRFGSHNLLEVVIRDRDVFNIYSTTRNITRIENRNNTVFLGGLEYDRISSRLEQPIQRLALERQFDVQAGARTRVEGNRLLIPAPVVNAAERAAPKSARRLDSAKVDRGWAQAEQHDAGKVRQMREQMKQQAQAPSDLQPNPKFDKNAQRQAAESVQQQLGTAEPQGTQQQTTQQPGTQEQQTMQPGQQQDTQQQTTQQPGKQQRGRFGMQPQSGQQRTQEQGTQGMQQQPGQQPQGMQQQQQPTDRQQPGQQMDQDRQQNVPAEEGKAEGKKGKGKKSKEAEPDTDTDKEKEKGKEKSKESARKGQQETQQQQGMQQGDQQKSSRYGFQQQPGDASRKTEEPGANRRSERSTRYGFQDQPGEMKERSKQNRTQEGQQSQPQMQQQQQQQQQQEQQKRQGQERSDSMQQQSSGGESQQGVQRGQRSSDGQESRSRSQGSSGQSTGEEQKSSKGKRGGD